MESLSAHGEEMTTSLGRYKQYYVPGAPGGRSLKTLFGVGSILCVGAFLYASAALKGSASSGAFRTKMAFVQIVYPVTGLQIGGSLPSTMKLVVDGVSTTVSLENQPSIVALANDCKTALRAAGFQSTSFAQDLNRQLLLVALPSESSSFSANSNDRTLSLVNGITYLD